MIMPKQLHLSMETTLVDHVQLNLAFELVV